MPSASGIEERLASALLAQVRRYAKKAIDPGTVERQGPISTRTREGLAGLGLFGLTIPEEYGGLGLGMKGACDMVAELSAVDRSVAITIGLHAGLGTRGLTELGGEPLRRRFLPELAAGARVGAFAATEPGAGSDLSAIRTTARRVGGGLEIDGEKSFVTNGGFAGLFTVLVRTPDLGGERACSLVCVPREAAGVEVGKEEDKLGIRGSSTVPVYFRGVAADFDQILGEPGKGLDHAHRLLVWGRSLLASGCVGAARAALRASVAHAATRRQFGRPLHDLGAVRASLADMAATVFAMESLVGVVAAVHARGEPVEALASAAKVFCSEGAFEVCDRAVQLHGALGYMEPVGVARMLRDVRVTRIFEGANDVLLVRLGLARLTSRAVEAPEALPEGLHEAQRATSALLARLQDAARSRAAYGVSIVHQQTQLQRIARAEIAVQASKATLRRAARAGREEQAVAAHAVERLTREGAEELDALAGESDREARSRAICQWISGAPFRPRRAEPVTEAGP